MSKRLDLSAIMSANPDLAARNAQLLADARRSETAVILTSIAEAREEEKPKRNGKYNAVRVETPEGEKFDSKKEARDCAKLRQAHGAENIIRQVSIPIGEKRMRLDFMRIHERLPDGRLVVEFIDSKGHVTQEWDAKRNHLKDKHGIEITLI